MKFGERLRELRLAKSKTLKEMASELCVDYTTIRNWEARGAETSFAMLVRLADYFDVSTDYLLGRED